MVMAQRHFSEAPLERNLLVVPQFSPDRETTG